MRKTQQPYGWNDLWERRAMTKGTSKHLLLIAALLVCLTVAFLPAAPHVASQTQSPFESSTITVNTSMSPNYDFIGSGPGYVVANASLTSIPTGAATLVELASLNISPYYEVAMATVAGQNVTVPVTEASTTAGTFYSISLPSNATSLYVNVEGSDDGNAFLWRYLTNAPIVYWNSPSVPTTYSDTLTLPSGSRVQSVYAFNGATLPSSEAVLVSQNATSTSYTITEGVDTMIIESTLFVPVAIAVTAIALAVVVPVSLLSFSSGRRALSRVSEALGLSRTGAVRRFPFVHRWKVRSMIKTRKLLALFLLCAFFMTAVAAVAGPDPQVKAYVIANPNEVPAIQSSLSSVAGNVDVITPEQDFSDFGVMSSVNMFNIVVISADQSLSPSDLTNFVLPSLGNVPLIIVDSSAGTNISQTVSTLYPNNVVLVQNAASLTVAEQQAIQYALQSELRSNILGLSLSHAGFEGVLVVEAVLSMVLIFFGWLFLGSLASEAMKQPDLHHVVMVVGSGIFTFVFSEAVYVVTSSMLSFPLSLHAILTGAHDITAIGLLGFGGGSTPRLAAGFLGVMIGVLGAEGAPKVNWRDLAIITVIALVLLADPLEIGQFAYQGLLLYAGNFSFGSAYTSSQTLKGFIYGVGTIFAGSVNPTYVMSAGKMLYFSGLLPLAYLKRLAPTTRALGLLLTAVLLGDGGVRVGEMTPDKTVIAILPGVVVGLAFAGILLGFTLVEKYMRGVWWSRP